MRRDVVARAALLVLAVTGLVIGVWAAFAPRSFYDDFPGGGHHWVAADGPYNEHLVRDVGELQLALGIMAIIAGVALGAALVRTVSVGWLVFAGLHLAFHLRHLHAFDSSDQVMLVVALFVPVAAAAVALVAVSRISDKIPTSTINRSSGSTT